MPATESFSTDSSTNRSNGATSSTADSQDSITAETVPADDQIQSDVALNVLPDGVSSTRISTSQGAVKLAPRQPPLVLITLIAIAIMIVGLVLPNLWLGIAGATVTLLLSLRVLWVASRSVIMELFSEEQRSLTVGLIGALAATWGILQLTGVIQRSAGWFGQLDWNAIGALGEVLGALGQILIAIIAVYVAWRQYVISKDLTIQQNVITQQQTIDSYFQGISDLVLDAEGLLEDWPQERAIAEGRTAAILSSVDAGGKAKVLRFLSRSKLLTPLKRDSLLGRAILDGQGGYQEDRDYGVRVIDLGVMLAASNLVGTDLRWTDLSEANLIRANLHDCDLVKTNLARTILCDADLSGSDMMGTRLYYGHPKSATPRSRTVVPDYATGAHTGAVIENANLTGVKRLSEAQRYYCCSWGGSATRATVPGGCEGIPNLLGR
ncbi:pentapeptide repeat-containing protein [Oculatella sp. LEGE 06141]|nr:pentapeptide repeat-containing protein [Oculatella sp. LEGE 06141]